MCCLISKSKFKNRRKKLFVVASAVFQITKDDATSKVDELAVVRLTNTLWETCTNLLGFALTNILWEPTLATSHYQVIKQGRGAGRRWNCCVNMLVHHFYNSPCCSMLN